MRRGPGLWTPGVSSHPSPQVQGLLCCRAGALCLLASENQALLAMMSPSGPQCQLDPSEQHFCFLLTEGGPLDLGLIADFNAPALLPALTPLALMWFPGKTPQRSELGWVGTGCTQEATAPVGRTLPGVRMGIQSFCSQESGGCRVGGQCVQMTSYTGRPDLLWTSPQVPQLSCYVTPKPSLRPLLAGREQKGIHMLVTLKRFRMEASPGGLEMH